MSILKTALEAIELLTTDNTSEQAQAAAADARIKIANAMAVEPVARVESIMANGRPFISRLPGARLSEGDALYLHPAPQQAELKNFVKLRAQLEQEWVEVRAIRDAYKSVTQQVAAPAGYVLVPTEVQDLYNFMTTAFVPMTSQQKEIWVAMDLARKAVAAQGDKP